MQNIITHLKERGLVEAVTSDELEEIASKPLTLYIGFDPTADSLHLGNLVGIMVAAFFKRAGHQVIVLVGGATGMIGDPGGKSSERQLLDPQTLERNIEGIRRSLQPLLGDTKILNNRDWLKEFSFIDFLRDVGKHFRMGVMLSKEMVKTRLNSEEGLSFTEFSYQLLQAYDFFHLNVQEGVTLQLGGSDQWGNIVAGTEFVRKRSGRSVYGLTFPLLTRSDGKKFGKSEGGAIWLNRDKLSPFAFYQHLYNMPDADMEKLFKALTFLPIEEIDVIISEIKENPHRAQRRLAEEVTRLVHGEEGLEEALMTTKAAKPGGQTELSAAVLKHLPTIERGMDSVTNCRLVDLLVETKLCASRSEARRLIAGGGLYLNNEKVSDDQLLIVDEHLVEGKFLLLGVGKKKKMVVSVERS